MSKPAHIGDLDVGEDIEFLRRAWRVQRAGWGVIGILLLAALAGAFGEGPFGQAREESAALILDYARFARRDAPGELRVQLRRPAAGEGLRIGVANRFLDSVTVESISPLPLRADRNPQRTVYLFAGAPDQVTLSIRYRGFGTLRGDIALGGDAEAVAFSTFVHP